MLLSVLKNIRTVLDRYFVYSYGQELERYILQNYPQNNSDVERLMFEFYNKQTRKFIWKKYVVF